MRVNRFRSGLAAIAAFAVAVLTLAPAAAQKKGGTLRTLSQ